MARKQNALQKSEEKYTRQSLKLNQDKFSEKLKQLKEYVRKSDYIDSLEQPIICASFGLSYRVSVFREEYSRRFYEFLYNNTTTVATASKETSIPHKYLCEVKFQLEEKNQLKVVSNGRCPTTGSSNVQYVSTNKTVWNNFKIPTNQLDLFEDLINSQNSKNR